MSMGCDALMKFQAGLGKVATTTNNHTHLIWEWKWIAINCSTVVKIVNPSKRLGNTFYI